MKTPWFFGKSVPKIIVGEELTAEQRKQRIARWLKRHPVTKCPAFMPEVEPHQELRDRGRKASAP